MKRFGQALLAILICQVAGGIGAIATYPNIATWYDTLIEPVFAPPNWLFGPAWVLLYTLMGIALFLVWEKRQDNRFGAAIIFFFTQLYFNALWSHIFFGWHNLGLAYLEILLLLGLIIITTIFFFKIDKAAGWLMVPYIVWVTFASFLNLAFWYLNYPYLG
ncbi:tryptophan-rich sensory protein [Patescibacteria group bacterium]|nr:tryptophan-rich sensory protein [Patescibacteria group bacterium]MBU1673894.1 tryptophan-rich sensory protein [Patescibacteria group bacterium]MBU1963433.1 tryptophan-rich sensory protein [Patescibacteria group bacterium]